MNRLRTLRIAVTAAALTMAISWPGQAEADGDHMHIGEVHFDPLIGVGIALFFGLITLLFVGQWIRVNAARQRGEAPLASSQSFDQDDAEI